MAKNKVYGFYRSMIYSKKLQSYVPISVEKIEYAANSCYPKLTKYIVKDGRINVGRVSLSDMPDGVFVNFIEKYNPKMYSGFGKIADQIEVEHCMNRGLKEFEIRSNAALNSHALHYLRGKRFIPEEVNEKVKKVIETTPKGENYQTKFIGEVKMYMPQEVIKKYEEVIKTSPLIKQV